MHSAMSRLLGGRCLVPRSLVDLLAQGRAKLEKFGCFELEIEGGPRVTEHHTLLVELTLPPALVAGGVLGGDCHLRVMGTGSPDVLDLVDACGIDQSHLQSP